jgi:hypothetical protein
VPRKNHLQISVPRNGKGWESLVYTYVPCQIRVSKTEPDYQYPRVAIFTTCSLFIFLLSHSLSTFSLSAVSVWFNLLDVESGQSQGQSSTEHSYTHLCSETCRPVFERSLSATECLLKHTWLNCSLRRQPFLRDILSFSFVGLYKSPSNILLTAETRSSSEGFYCALGSEQCLLVQ